MQHYYTTISFLCKLSQT